MKTMLNRVVRHGVSSPVSRRIRCAALPPPLRILPARSYSAAHIGARRPRRHTHKIQIEILKSSNRNPVMRGVGDEDGLRRREAQLPTRIHKPHPCGASSSGSIPPNGGGYSGAGSFFKGSFPSGADTSLNGSLPSGTASLNGSFPSGATSFPCGGSGNGRGRGSSSPISPPTTVAPWYAHYKHLTRAIPFSPWQLILSRIKHDSVQQEESHNIIECVKNTIKKQYIFTHT